MLIFEGHDFAFLGDIHKTNQKLDEEGRIRYAGSTIQQNHGESNDKGFLIWDIKNADDFSVKHIVIENPKPFISLCLTEQGQLPKIGDDIPEGARLRIIAETNLSLDQIKRAIDVAQKKFKPEAISFLNKSTDISSVEGLLGEYKKEDIRDVRVQERLILEYLKDYHIDEETIERIFALNRKYETQIDSKGLLARNIHYEVLEMEWNNFFKYGEGNRILFSGLEGIVGIFGKNFSGKSSVIDTLLFCLFGSISKKARKNLNLINHDRDYADAKIKLKIDNKVYTIHRLLEKTSKKVDGNEVADAKSSVNFSVVDLATGIEENLNAESGPKTNQIIEKCFGTLDDFLLMNMSSQTGALNFIEKGSKDRKDILGNFLDIGFFSQKHFVANDDAKEQKGVLKRLEERGFDKEQEETTAELKLCELAKSEKVAECNILKSLKEEKENQMRELKSQLDKLPYFDINISQVRKELAYSLNKLQNLETSITEEEQALKAHIETKEKAQVLLEKYDIESIKKNNEISIQLQSQLDDLLRDIGQSEEKNKGITKRISLLEDIPCGNQFPTCKFIKDAFSAKEELNLLEAVKSKNLNTKSDLVSQLKALKPEEITLEIQRYDRLSKLTTDKQALIQQIQNNTIPMLKLQIKSAKDAISALKTEEKKYEDNKDIIDNHDTLQEKLDAYLDEIKVIGEKIKKCDEEVMVHYKSHGFLEQKLENIKAGKIELEQIRREYEAYDLYLRCMHPGGIAYDLLKRSLPAINNELSKILTNIVDFQVYFLSEDKRLDIFIKRMEDSTPTPIELCSGAEKAIAAMAIRLALISISSIPKADIFILDEPGTALDAESMEGFTRILDLVKSFFSCVFLISHLDSLKDTADTIIEIQHNGKYAYVNC